MTPDFIAELLAAALIAATPLLLAGLGELIVERSGVLNLGVEGMMLVGAVCGFATAYSTGSLFLGFMASALGGLLLSSLFALLVLGFASNQVASGLALTLFGSGLSALIGQGYVGLTLEPLQAISIPGLSSIPYIGVALFQHDIMVYLAVLTIPVSGYVLMRTRLGMIHRAMGESDEAAHTLGYPVLKWRLYSVLIGGAFAGLGGGYLSLAYTPLWAENMTAGRGWIALALVVFATWRPVWLLIGALVFGGVTLIQLHSQAFGLAIPSQFMSMLPYLTTIVVLVVISRYSGRIGAPASLGRPFRAVS